MEAKSKRPACKTGQCQIMQTANTLGLYPQHTSAGNPTSKQLMISKTRQSQPPVAIRIRAKLVDALGCDTRCFCILPDCQQQLGEAITRIAFQPM